MSKVLVFSGPFEDSHKTFVVTSKSLGFVDYIFGMNDWSDGYEVSDLDETFLETVEEKIGRAVEDQSDIREYFQILSDDSSVTVDKFSNMLVEILPTRRGSWSSYVWVKG